MTLYYTLNIFIDYFRDILLGRKVPYVLFFTADKVSTNFKDDRLYH